MAKLPTIPLRSTPAAGVPLQHLAADLARTLFISLHHAGAYHDPVDCWRLAGRLAAVYCERFLEPLADSPDRDSQIAVWSVAATHARKQADALAAKKATETRADTPRQHLRITPAPAPAPARDAEEADLDIAGALNDLLGEAQG